MSRKAAQTAEILPTPPTCIRGPELADNAQIADQIRSADEAALQAYQQGIELIITIQGLQRDEAHLEELKQTRAFLIGQLELMEREHPRAFDAARATFDQRQRQPASLDAPGPLVEVEPCSDGFLAP